MEFYKNTQVGRSSRPKDQIQVSCITGRFFTVWATREVLLNTRDALIYSQQQWQRRQWHPNPVFLPGNSHGRGSLVGCSPWGHEELDTTEQLHFHFSLSWIREGNGNPLQCSCLENPRDRGAWWAAVYGVTQSRTRLKQISSSSNNNESMILLLEWPLFLGRWYDSQRRKLGGRLEHR